MSLTPQYGWDLPDVGADEDAWGDLLRTLWTDLDTLLSGTNATEFAILNGATVSTAELNKLAGVTWTPTDFNGLTATVTQLNYVDATSSIQTQLDAKSPIASPTFTGTPAAPTAAAGTSTAQIATTAFVDGYFQFAHFRDQRASGTNGDVRTASTWSKHTLQTSVLNNITGMTLTSSVISAPAGTYRVDVSMGFDANSLKDFVIRLRDTTNNVTLAFSASASASGTGDAAVVPMYGVFTLSGTANLELQYWQTSTGGWQATSNGDIEVGADILLQKVG